MWSFQDPYSLLQDSLSLLVVCYETNSLPPVTSCSVTDTKSRTELHCSTNGQRARGVTTDSPETATLLSTLCFLPGENISLHQVSFQLSWTTAEHSRVGGTNAGRRGSPSTHQWEKDDWRASSAHTHTGKRETKNRSPYGGVRDRTGNRDYWHSPFSQFQLCHSTPVLGQVAAPQSVTWKWWLLTAPSSRQLLKKEAKCCREQELFIQESRNCSSRRAAQWSRPAHCSLTRRPHLRPSVDEEHSRVLLSRLQIVRSVHHPIERKARGTLEGEHFWGNVIRKGACRRREQRVWFNREWIDG